MAEEEGVLVVCAHSDDQILGCGGTIAKYAKQGIPVYAIIFSYGEKSLPHLKEDFVRLLRLCHLSLKIQSGQLVNIFVILDL